MPKKIAIFLEGQGELIFIRNILFQLFSDIPYSFTCMKLYGEAMIGVPYSIDNPHADIHFSLINVQNDTRVLSAIKEREEGLLAKGFDQIFGLRDMYSEEYKKRSNVINEDLIDKFVETASNSIENMSEPKKISFYFSIMEIEAWWLSMYGLFEKINESLTESYIESKVGYKLSNIDPEKHFFHPGNELKKILNLANIKYNKKLSDVEAITCNLDILDIASAVENDRCSVLRKFFEEILKISGSNYKLC